MDYNKEKVTERGTIGVIVIMAVIIILQVIIIGLVTILSWKNGLQKQEA